MKYFFIGIVTFLIVFFGTGGILFIAKSFELGRMAGHLEHRIEYTKAVKEMYPKCREKGGYLTVEPFPGGKMLIGCTHFRNLKMTDHEFVVYEGEI